MMSPVRLVPSKTMKAPTEVIKEETPSQASLPTLPALPRVAIEIKKRSDPTKTLGWLKKNFIFESKKANERKIKGKNAAAQENESVSKSFNFTRINPLRVKETSTKPARAKKTIWEMEKIVALLSLKLNFLFGTLWCFLAMTTLYQREIHNPKELSNLNNQWNYHGAPSGFFKEISFKKVNAGDPN